MHQPWSRRAWELSREQHGVVSRSQLLGLGMSPKAILHRLGSGRLHEIHRGVYAVGRPQIGRLGLFRAATLACGPGARLSHHSGADLWGIRKQRSGPIDVVVPANALHRRPGIRAHRRAVLVPPRAVAGVPVGDPTSILIDLASGLPTAAVEESVNEADRLGLIATDLLRSELDGEPRRPGLGRLRRILDAQTFSRAQNALERRFLRIARAAGLTEPVTQAQLGSYRVDFYWPTLRLVVETDGLTYHRTAAQQAIDVSRDQAHLRAGRRVLRFTHAQVFHRPEQVRAVLEDTAHRAP